MIFGADVRVPLPPPSFASSSQPLEKFSYFLAHAREDIPSGIGVRGLWVLDQSNTNFLEYAVWAKFAEVPFHALR